MSNSNIMDISKVTNSKVCIFCFGEINESIFEYLVFIIDLKLVGRGENDLDIVSMHPAVRMDWDSFNFPAICVLDSKLFVFDHHHGSFNEENYTEKFKTDGKSVFTFQLSEGVSNLKLEKSMMCKEAESMNNTKVYPKAVVTPDVKILVFSSLIEVYCSDETVCDFELYDPCTRVWSKLPNLPVSATQGPDYSELHIMTFTFINRNIFFLRTAVGIFTLDLENPIAWGRSGFHRDECIPKTFVGNFVIIEKQLCVIPYRAFDIRLRGTRLPKVPNAVVTEREDVFAILDYIFPEMWSFTGGHSSPSGSITLLDHEKKKNFSVCFLHAGINDETKHAEMVLQVYDTRLPSCLKELSACRKKKVKEDKLWWKRKRESLVLPDTLKLKSIKVVVEEEFTGLNLCGFSSICW